MFQNIKKSVFITLILLSNLYCNWNNKDDLFIGKWELEQIVTGKEVVNVRDQSMDFEISNNIYYLNFYESGKIEGYIFGRQLTGYWNYSDKSKKISVEDRVDDPKYYIRVKEISKKKLIVSGVENGKSSLFVFLPKNKK